MSSFIEFLTCEEGVPSDRKLYVGFKSEKYLATMKRRCEDDLCQKSVKGGRNVRRRLQFDDIEKKEKVLTPKEGDSADSGVGSSGGITNGAFEQSQMLKQTNKRSNVDDKVGDAKDKDVGQEVSGEPLFVAIALGDASENSNSSLLV